MSRAVWSTTMVGNDMVVKVNRRQHVKIPSEIRRDFVSPEQPQERPIPYQNLRGLAFNVPAMERTPFALPSLRHYSPRFFSRIKITSVIIVLVLVGTTVALMTYKQQISTLASKVSTAVSQELSSHKTTVPLANPQQIIIHITAPLPIGLTLNSEVH